MDFDGGHIALHRKLRHSWVYDDAELLKAWITILFDVNWQDKETLNGGKVLFVKRGQASFSRSTWAQKFGRKWDRNKVNRFFTHLETADMIRTREIYKSTLLTVCNYDIYQIKPVRNEQETNTKRVGDEHETNTIEESNNIYIFINNAFTPGMKELVKQWERELLNWVNSVTKKTGKEMDDIWFESAVKTLAPIPEEFRETSLLNATIKGYEQFYRPNTPTAEQLQNGKNGAFQLMGNSKAADDDDVMEVMD